MGVESMIEQLKEVLDQQLQESYDLGKAYNTAEIIMTLQFMARENGNPAVISFVGKVRDKLSK